MNCRHKITGLLGVIVISARSDDSCGDANGRSRSYDGQSKKWVTIGRCDGHSFSCTVRRSMTDIYSAWTDLGLALKHAILSSVSMLSKS